ncbi:MAG: NAD-dependent epimerase/dehydratase family protein [Planctomycetia bacterium]|nr:NAD-dependent epimerase/dehydratase family protein [Planctomycetia bacterium]
MSKLIFGCGYLGRRVADRWRDAGDQVFVVTRDSDHARSFAKQGYTPIIADVVRPRSLVNLPAAETVLYAVGYDRHAGVSIHEVFASGLESVLDALPAGIGKLIYISSTGVYAQSQGEWVDEDSPCQPERNGGLACLAAERVLAAHRLGSRGIVLRLAGLYGAGRIPNAAEIRLNQPIAAPQHRYLNLIHVDDAASVVLAAAERAKPPRTYVVSDGHPVQRRAYYEELARLLGAPPPKFAPPPPDAPASVRAASDKRARSARMLAELGVTLQYPSYHEGLAAIVATERAERAETAPG